MEQQYYPFRLEPLNYRFNDLEPYLDLQTVLLHHGNHQQHYVDELNAAMEFWPLYQEWSLFQLLRNPSQKPLAFGDFVALREKIHEVCDHTY